jgi:hypothetical protein
MLLKQLKIFKFNLQLFDKKIKFHKYFRKLNNLFIRR